MARIITDNFNRIGATLGSSPEGWSWTDTLDTGGVIGTSSNVAYLFGTNSHARAEQDLDSINQFCQVTYQGDATGSTQCGVAVRYSSAADSLYYLTVRVDGTSTRIIKVVAGTNTTLVTSTTTGVTPGDVVRLEARGQLLIGYLNGTEITRVTDSTFLTGLRAGMVMVASAGGGKARQDDFSAGSLGMGNFLPFFRS